MNVAAEISEAVVLKSAATMSAVTFAFNSLFHRNSILHASGGLVQYVVESH